jgi:hypothetical protein
LTFWRAEEIWKGQSCYIIGGGPSLLTQNLALIKGQNVIVINSSYQAFPEAQFLVFSDMRWWCHHLRLKPLFQRQDHRHIDGGKWRRLTG